MRRLLDVVVLGHPEPKGSTRSFQKGARIVTTSDNPNLPRWTKAIREAVERGRVEPDPVAGPVYVRLRFRLGRPKDHFGTHGLRPSAPLFPTTKPDKDKLERAVLDALTGLVYLDDAQVVDGRTTKDYADAIGVPAGVRIEAYLVGDEPLGLALDTGAGARP